jgi:hypothetical protein
VLCEPRAVYLLVNRDDFPQIVTTLANAGFVHDRVMDVECFRDGPEGKPSEAVHLLFAKEVLRPEHLLPLPEIRAVADPAGFQVVELESLLLMKLLSNRDKDRTHFRDLIGVRLVNNESINIMPPVLCSRLQGILDTPMG